MESFTQAQWPAWAYAGIDPFSGYNQVQTYPTYLADSIEAAYQSHQQHLVHHHQMSRTTESKPRLSKEEVEVLEAEFQKNHKPNSSTKKALAESMRVDNARINNWFQNRRAREKKENNIRAYEARQKLEKEKGDTTSTSSPSDDAEPDFVASSAPFPEPKKTSHATTAFSASSPASSSSDSQSDAGPSMGDEQDCVSSVSGHQTEEESFSPDLDMQPGHGAQLSAFLDAQAPVSSMAASDISIETFGSLESAPGKGSEYLLDTYHPFIGDDASDLGSSFSTQTFPSDQAFLDGSLQFHGAIDQETEFSPVSDIDAAMQLKTPPAIDIASRRNRRPPPLSINGSRSSSFNVPKTAVDLSKRGQFGNTMRRVASVNGMVRIAKPCSGAPRSPFTDRKAEGLLHLNRSPNMNGCKSSIAPPTPNTPIVSAHLSVDSAIASSFSMNEKSSFANMSAQDPTLRTPPTTPGIMDQLFNLNVAYDASLSDEPLATPGLGRFPGEFEIPDASNTVPHYIANDCPSQPVTPLYAPNMGPAYFGYAGGNAEYNWSEATTSARSSPGQNAQRMQFMNMTASNFS